MDSAPLECACGSLVAKRPTHMGRVVLLIPLEEGLLCPLAAHDPSARQRRLLCKEARTLLLVRC